MTKLNQILAVEKGVKTRTYATITEFDKHLQKEALHTGITRTYRKRDEEGEDLPSEQQPVQINVSEVLDEMQKQFAEAWNVTATKEWANREACADIVLADGTKLMADVPVTYLLFLEKQLVDLRTIFGRLPTLDPGERWTWSPEALAYQSEMHETHRAKKVPKVLVRYEATKEHPAQTEVYTEDVIVGFWETIKFSGACPAERKLELLERVDEALKAVKIAREAANDMTVVTQNAASAMLDHLFE